MKPGLRSDRAGLLLVTFMCLVAAPALGDPPGLAVLMERMQTYTHKVQLSIEARNAPLADFYLHELEETSEFVVENVAHYGDHPVGPLVKEMLLPLIEALEDVVKAGEWEAGDARFTDLIRACNACHLVTGHGYVRIAPASGNPYAQDFGVADD